MIRYVSNTAVNGYGLGNDSTGTGTLAAPYLTIDKAHAVATNGDIITVNPTTTAYTENTGGVFYLSITKQVTITADLTYGFATIKPTSGANRVLNSTGSNVSLIGLIFDCDNLSAVVRAIVINASVTGFYMQSCKTQNMNAASALTGQDVAIVGAMSASTFTDNDFNSAIGIYPSSSGTTLTNVFISHNRFNCAKRGFDNNTAGGRAIACTIDDNTFIGNQDDQDCYGVYLGDISGVIVSNNKFFRYSKVAILIRYKNGNGLMVSNNDSSGYGGLLLCLGVNYTNVRAIGNKIIQYNASSDADPIQVYSGYGFEATDNYIETDAILGHAIMAGVDGVKEVVINRTLTDSQNLGDVAGNTYISQPFTFIAASDASNSKEIAQINIPIQKQGTPTGVVTAYVYTNNAGSPGTLISTSDYSLNATDAPGISNYASFYFYNRIVAAYGGIYHIVLKYTGTINNTDYIKILSNTTNVGKTSTNGTTWNTGTKAILFSVCTGNYENISPLILDNTITCTNRNVPQLHAVFLASVSGGIACGNRVIDGGGPLLITKLVDGTIYPCIMFSNVIYMNRGTQQCLRDKGSRLALFFNNTLVGDGVQGNIILLDNDVSKTDSNTTNLNGQPSRNARVQNNVVIAKRLINSVLKLGLVGTPNGCIDPIINNNLYYNETLAPLVDDSRSGTSITYSTLSLWKASGLDINSAYEKPEITGIDKGFVNVKDFAPSFDTKDNFMFGQFISGVNRDFLGQPFVDLNFDPEDGFPVGALGVIKNKRLL